LRLGKQITIALIALPLAELIVFAAVAATIGVAAALLLMIATSLAGGLVLRHVGRAGLGAVRAAVDGPAEAAGAGAPLLLGIAGILLILPGFITDAAGALLLVPALRRHAVATFGRWMSAARDPDGRPAVVDLAPDEWRQVSETGPERPARDIDGTRGAP